MDTSLKRIIEVSAELASAADDVGQTSEWFNPTSDSSIYNLIYISRVAWHFALELEEVWNNQYGKGYTEGFFSGADREAGMKMLREKA